MLCFMPKSIWYNADKVAVIIQFSRPVYAMSRLNYYRYCIGIMSPIKYSLFICKVFLIVSKDFF